MKIENREEGGAKPFFSVFYQDDMVRLQWYIEIGTSPRIDRDCIAGFDSDNHILIDVYGYQTIVHFDPRKAGVEGQQRIAAGNHIEHLGAYIRACW